MRINQHMWKTLPLVLVCLLLPTPPAGADQPLTKAQANMLLYNRLEDPKEVKRALAAGADPNFWPAYDIGVLPYYPHEDIVRRNTLVHAVYSSGLVPRHEPNYKFRRELDTAYMESLRLLLAAGARTDWVGKDGKTLLHMATYTDGIRATNHRLIALLFEHGAPYRYSKVHATPLIGHLSRADIIGPEDYGRVSDYWRSIELMLENGAVETINVADKHGETALVHAFSADARSVRMLLEAGADPNRGPISSWDERDGTVATPLAALSLYERKCEGWVKKKRGLCRPGWKRRFKKIRKVLVKFGARE